ncbi:MAG TPA: RnfABCDGE type electron transport complex subunit D [Sedimentisphaerales bacterium]|jgi:electron transport complex protein RnfD|nr:RnfABCDGE type electron transport complex subunit D [Sedimentisphaerales bacterium]HNU30063.1 RnfABCDGE type electron transport complex subunit D [Sedimentisphaerales bacterium]
MPQDLSISFAPHIRKPLSTQRVMLDVLIGLIPLVAAAGIYFRLRALLLIGVCVVGCAVTEWVSDIIRKKPGSLGDLSAVVTGVILGLSLPPALPFWTAAIGSVIAIGVGKMAFGGLGANVFNPAMVGRAFLTASFGMLMTTWTVPATIDGNLPQVGPENIVDARTQATPLGWSKIAIQDQNGAAIYSARQFLPILTGNIPGSLGETSAIAALLGGAYLLIRRTIDPHIPLAVLLSAFVFAAIAYAVNPDAYVQPFYHLASGALLFGAFFIATDPVTAPLTRRGMWLFGLGVGAITLLIRIVGKYPEGFMFAVLVMNGLTPLIDRLFRRVPVGGKPRVG